MKKIVLLLLVFFIPFIGHAESKHLYDILKNEALSNGNAKEFEGQHQDSMNEALSKYPIYYWNGSSSDDYEAIKNHYNVIFADMCWQIIRTTDTGGVRLLYNGEPLNNQCLDNRPNHIGYVGISYTTVQAAYYYGTDYTYDSSSNLFYLSGNVYSSSWNETTFNNLRGKYTCLKTDASEGCERLYMPMTYKDESVGYFYSIYNNLNYSIIGKSTVNDEKNSPAYAGYMYNKVYSTDRFNPSQTDYPFNRTRFSSNHYYAEEVTWDPSTGKYTLVNPIRITNSTPNSTLIGKYLIQTFTSSQTVDYVVSYNDSSLIDTHSYITFSNGETISDYNSRYYAYASTYTDNGDGTFTLNDYNSFNLKDYFSNYTRLKDKYYCENTTGNGICNELKYAYAVYPQSINYYDAKRPIKYANGFTYENGQYVLNGDSLSYWGTPNYLQNSSTANQYHYTCFNESGVCEEIAFIFNYYDSKAIYILLSNGTSIEEALVEMLSDENVNKNDSRLKLLIERWYEKHLNEYSNYIDDTIYCNSRRINSLGGWDPNGGHLSGSNINLYFASNSLNCINETDRFSISNEKAKLKYPVAIPSYGDMYLMNSDVRKGPEQYLLLTPSDFAQHVNTEDISFHSIDTSYGNSRGNFFSDGIRPSISLIPNMRFSSGTGSKEDPYIVDYNLYYNIDIVVKNETKDLDIEIDDITSVPEGEQVTFTVTPIKGFKTNGIQILDRMNQEIPYQETTTNNQYTFIMPGEDVTIIPSYERTSASVTVEDNPHTKEIVIEVNDATAVVYEDVVRFTVEAEEGYELVEIEITDEEGNEIEYHKTNKENEYEFIMPDTNVLIKPIYQRIEEPIPMVNPNTGRRFLWIGILLLGLLTGTLYKKQKMKV